jgi:hypothetical protein
LVFCFINVWQVFIISELMFFHNHVLKFLSYQTNSKINDVHTKNLTFNIYLKIYK